MRQTALVTGASGGIGKAFAEKFAAEGINVILIARSEDTLNHLAQSLQAAHSIEATVIVKDLTDPSAPQAIYDTLEAAGTQVDILVNNAGYATYGLFHTLDMQRELNMIQLNITTLTHLTRLFLPGMVQRGHGKILNLASTAAFAPGPLMAVYYATKAYVLSFSEAIAVELKDTGVTVTVLCPGPTETGFQQRAEMTDSKLVQDGLMDIETVVEQGYNALMNGDVVHVPGLMNKLQVLAPRFLPRGMVRRMVRDMQERVGH